MLYISPKKNSKYVMPVKVFFGRDILINTIKRQSLNKNTTLLVCGEHFKNSDLFSKIEKEFGFTVYKNRINKSDFTTINKLSEYLKEKGIVSIISIGGGTILDVVKSACIVAKNGTCVEEFLIDKTKELTKKGLLHIAVPTTSGTGSEVTPWATIWENNRKYSLTSPLMFSEIAIVDPALTDNLELSITATSGIDALCQSIESYWNINGNPTSRNLALKSIANLVKFLPLTAYKENKVYRNKMALGSLYGGLAFSNTQTTICHAISYPITAHWSIQHGQSVCLTLPYFITEFIPMLRVKDQQKLFDAMEVSSAKEASLKVIQIVKSIGLKTRLSELYIPVSGIDLILSESFYTNRANNTPRQVSRDEVEKLLHQIY